MATKIMMVKAQDGSLRPATEYDAEQLKRIKTGQAVNMEMARQTDRSLKHHRLFFGGFLPTVFEYWQPEGGLIAQNEIEVVDWVTKRIDRLLGMGGQIHNMGKEALKALAVGRAEKVGQVPYKDINGLRDWLAREAGHYDLLDTPAGFTKKVKSISFARMSQDEFNDFYKRVFNVAWSMVLSKTFSSEAEAQAAVDHLMALGN